MSFPDLKLSKMLKCQVLLGLLHWEDEPALAQGEDEKGTELSLESAGEAPLWELTSLLQERNMMAQEGPFIVVNKFTSPAYILP